MKSMERIGIKVSLLGPLRMMKGVRELDILLPENATLEDLMALLSQKLHLEKGWKSSEGMGFGFYIIMVNGIPINPEVLGSYRLKDRDIVTFAPFLAGGG